MKSHYYYLIVFFLSSFTCIAKVDVFPVVFNCDEGNECNCTRPEKLDSFDVQLVLDSISSGKIKDNKFLACCYHQIGIDSHIKGQFLEAIKYYKLAKQLRLTNRDNLLWKTWFNIALSYEQMFQFEPAYNYYKKAFDTEENKSINDSIAVLLKIGDCLSELGDIEQAIEYGKIALQKNPNDLQSNFVFADILENTKDSLLLNQAVEYADKAIQISEQVNYRNFLPRILSVKGNALNKLVKYDEAIKSYEDALKMTSKSNIIYQSLLNNNIATVFYEQKEHHSAIEKLNEFLIILKNHQKTPFNNSYSSIYENLADNYAKLNDYEKALKYYQNALINHTNNFRSEEIFQNPNPKDTSLFIYAHPKVIRVLHLKATAAYQYYQQNNNIKYLTLANQTYQTAFNFHDKLQKDISTENSRLFQAKNIVPYIENALKIIYQQQKNGQDISKTAFRFMEKNKATVLLQSMNEADALQFANLPDSLLEQEKDLKIAITFHKKQLNEAIEYEDTTEIERLNSILFEEKQQYSQLINHLENNYPDYYRLKYQQNLTQLADVQKSLDHKTALLEYFVGDSAIYILSIQKDKSKLYRLKKPNEWKQIIDDFRLALTDKKIVQDGVDNHKGRFALNAFFLYKCLLSEPLKYVSATINRLQIIPDAELNYIPFELLLTESVDTNNLDYKQLPYLLRKYSTGYVFSGAFLTGKQATAADTLKSFAGFAAEYENSAFGKLSSAKENVIDIAKKFSGDAFTNASKQDFFEVASNYKTLFFAMHAELDDKNALNSALIFSPKTDSSDFKLSAADLYNTSLNAQMAVLSACETGIGKINKGEGVMSLSRAFTYAGCPSLVMSLWKIPNASTSKLTASFFDILKKGLHKDKALQQSKLAYLEISPSRLSHPVYWAGLVATGDLSPLELGEKAYTYWYLPFIIAASGFTFWYFKN